MSFFQLDQVKRDSFSNFFIGRETNINFHQIVVVLIKIQIIHKDKPSNSINNIIHSFPAHKLLLLRVPFLLLLLHCFLFKLLPHGWRPVVEHCRHLELAGALLDEPTVLRRSEDAPVVQMATACVPQEELRLADQSLAVDVVEGGSDEALRDHLPVDAKNAVLVPVRKKSLN